MAAMAATVSKSVMEEIGMRAESITPGQQRPQATAGLVILNLYVWRMAKMRQKNSETCVQEELS